MGEKVEGTWLLEKASSVLVKLAASAQRCLDLGEGCCCARRRAREYAAVCFSCRDCKGVERDVKELGGTGGSCITRRDAAWRDASGPGGAWVLERIGASLCAFLECEGV